MWWGVAALLLLFPARPEARWLRLDCGAVHIYTDAAPQRARVLGERMILARRLWSQQRLPFPVLVWGLQSGQRFASLRPGSATRGFYQSAPNRDYIVLDLNTPDWERVALHESVHLMLHHGAGPLPQWLEEGLAEFYSTVETVPGHLRLGRPIASHLRLLAASPLLAGSELAGITKESPGYHDSAQAGIFYAQSWAMVHLLRLGERDRTRFGAFLEAVSGGEPQASAFPRVFGQTFSEAVSRLRAYLNRGSLPVLDLPLPGEDAAASLSCAGPQAMDEVEAELAWAEAAVHSGRWEEAERVYRRMAGMRPDNARSAAALGMAALARKRPAEAKRYFEQAMQDPQVAAAVPFEYAMLLREEGAPADRVRIYLEKTIGIDPNFAEAHFLLGVAHANEKQHETALPHLERAAAIFPRQSYFWRALAVTYQALGQTEKARTAAQRALDAAANVQEAEMARAALRGSGQSASSPPPRARQTVITPESWNRATGGVRAEGVLERIDCLGESARFVLRTSGQSLALWVEKPGDVLLQNVSTVTFEFRCGPQKPKPVVVEYRAQTGSPHQTAGILTSLEFR